MIDRTHETRLPPGPYVCLSVADTGEGMDQETLNRAMEPFFTTKGVGKGTGLGLSMVHGLTEQSGGRLVLRSRKGEGTVAELWLPIAGEAPSNMAEALGGGIPSPRHSRSLAVLAVDDDSLVLMNTAIMLEDLGHTVFAASSGSEALNIFEREKDIDLIVTDQAMPRMSGIQLIDAIRSKRPDIAAVLATGYAEFPDGANIDTIKLAKPFSEGDLARVIDEAVQTTDIGSDQLKLSAY
jgi:CheY-like chemotaxis protein